MPESKNIVGAIAPPPGETANFVNPPNQNGSGIALHTVCLTLVTICITIRLYTRHFITKKLGWDDYFCIIAYLLTIAFSILLLLGVLLALHRLDNRKAKSLGNARGLGHHLWDVPATELPAALKMLTIAEFVYLALAGIIKISCLLFYRRIFDLREGTLNVIHGGIIFIAVTYTATFFTTIFECTPIEKSWNKALPGHCYPPKILPYYSGAINVATDIFVLVVPLPALFQLHLSLNRKLRVMGIFGLGIFACITSIIRLVQTSTLYTNFDATWNLGHIQIWAVIEVNVGIICACLLALPAFIRQWYSKNPRSSAGRPQPYSWSRTRARTWENTKSVQRSQSDELDLNGEYPSLNKTTGVAPELPHIINGEWEP